MARPQLLPGAALLLVTAMVGYGCSPAQTPEERGKYLAHVMVCVECHTPGVLTGGERGPDLAGSEFGYELPGLGVFHGPNLTPDVETGLGSWSEQDIIRAIRTGERPDGRILAPAMPWRAFAEITDADAQALVTYLKSLDPVSNQVPGPFGPSETPTGMYYKFMIPDRD